MNHTVQIKLNFKEYFRGLWNLLSTHLGDLLPLLTSTWNYWKDLMSYEQFALILKNHNRFRKFFIFHTLLSGPFYYFSLYFYFMSLLCFISNCISKNFCMCENFPQPIHTKEVVKCQFLLLNAVAAQGGHKEAFVPQQPFLPPPHPHTHPHPHTQILVPPLSACVMCHSYLIAPTYFHDNLHLVQVVDRPS